MGTLTLQGSNTDLEFNAPEMPNEFGFTSVIFDRPTRSLRTIPFGKGFEGTLAAVTSERTLNKRHPIVEFLLSRQDSVVDDPAFSFLHSLAGTALEKGALEALESKDFSNQWMNLHFSGLGWHFRNTDFALLKPEHRPPYRCWLPDKGFFEITEETMGKLAEVQAVDWHRRREPRHI
jgi:hypothetical protein